MRCLFYPSSPAFQFLVLKDSTKEPTQVLRFEPCHPPPDKLSASETRCNHCFLWKHIKESSEVPWLACFTCTAENWGLPVMGEEPNFQWVSFVIKMSCGLSLDSSMLLMHVTKMVRKSLVVCDLAAQTAFQQRKAHYAYKLLAPTNTQKNKETRKRSVFLRRGKLRQEVANKTTSSPTTPVGDGIANLVESTPGFTPEFFRLKLGGVEDFGHFLLPCCFSKTDLPLLSSSISSTVALRTGRSTGPKLKCPWCSMTSSVVQSAEKDFQTCTVVQLWRPRIDLFGYAPPCMTDERIELSLKNNAWRHCSVRIPFATFARLRGSVLWMEHLTMDSVLTVVLIYELR